MGWVEPHVKEGDDVEGDGVWWIDWSQKKKPLGQLWRALRQLN